METKRKEDCRKEATPQGEKCSLGSEKPKSVGEGDSYTGRNRKQIEAGGGVSKRGNRDSDVSKINSARSEAYWEEVVVSF